LGLSSPGAVITGCVGIIFTATGLFTVVGAQRMMRLQSYGLAVAAGVLQLIPSAGSLLGLPIGIWALIILTRHEVHVAFIEIAERTPVSVNRGIAKKAVNIFAATASSDGKSHFSGRTYSVIWRSAVPLVCTLFRTASADFGRSFI